jgi:hypothetical protein
MEIDPPLIPYKTENAAENRLLDRLLKRRASLSAWMVTLTMTDPGVTESTLIRERGS